MKPQQQSKKSHPDLSPEERDPVIPDNLFKRQERLLRIMQELITRDDEEFIFRKLATEIKDLFDCSGVSVYLLEDAGKRLLPVFSDEPPHSEEIMRTHLSVDQCLAGKVVKAGRGMIFNDAANQPGGYHIPDTPKDEIEHLMVVLMPDRDHNPLGVITLLRQQKQFDESELTSGNLLGIYVSAILNNARHYQALKREIEAHEAATARLKASEQRFRSLVEFSPLGILSIDTTGKILLANSTLIEILGSPSMEATLAINILDFPLLQKIGVSEDFRRVMKFGHHVENEVKYTSKWGKTTDIRYILVPLRNEQQEVVGALGSFEDITTKKIAETALRENEARYRALFEKANDAIFLMDGETFIDCNTKTLDMFKCTREQIIGKPPTAFSPKHQPDGELSTVSAKRKINAALAGHPQFFEWQHSHYDGMPFDAEVSLSSIELSGKNFLLAIVRDISERKQGEAERRKLENQLRQSQKMESIGRLAGGVAHDFNNMLSVILAHTEIVLNELDPDHPIGNSIREIQKAGNRSAEITRQLLGFARKQVIQPEVLNLDKTVTGMLNMLRRLIGEEIELQWHPGSARRCVKMDASQADQILTNLCINARDAIDGVGKITIETSLVSLDDAYCADHEGFRPGEYVLLSVSDDGKGMDAVTLEKIFEPFYTTKEVGQGTGLGLAMIFGIVKQNNGFINVYSEPGQGTTFKLYLPQQMTAMKEHATQASDEIPTGHGETILLVEDELAILNLAKTILEYLGYRVLAANSPREAIEISQSRPEKIHLLMTDVVMPQMNGQDLAAKLLAAHPDLKILYMSGYTADVIAQRGILREGVNFIQKPFSRREVASHVHQVLQAI
ncbi:MAG: PAS domain S-box protein [Candidatus Marinimicrobia bacterium]|nr:PAS domain S-box protein [Candidatus Neomarinimicrobiota bacterium]MCF7840184.1 PAS domain S-box protein [Candidatus Neomarinimicrobiota bacterium]